MSKPNIRMIYSLPQESKFEEEKKVVKIDDKKRKDCDKENSNR